ncbi:MAG: CCA tRNA nucleotidyltransferase [Planctomycetota bacterium]|nr:CCA tRNA nucleotidyltransferase [Planctomycetota bacterium]
MADFQVAVSIIDRLVRAGYRALFCGGCVRDSLLGREPKDFDIVTSAPPQAVESLFSRTHAVGRKFGIVVVLEAGGSYEVATFRRDGEYGDGRRPDSVSFGTEIEDAKRRDFTINGLFMDPHSGEVFDHVGGGDDLRNCLVRTIGDPCGRFREDHLRLLRAVRFAAQLDFRIEKDTRRAMVEEAACLKNISRERIGDELERILTGPRPGLGGRLLSETGLLKEILPSMGELSSSSLEQTLGRLEEMEPGTDLAVGLGALVLDLERIGANVERALKSLRRSTRVIQEVVWMVSQERMLCRYRELTLAQKKRFLRQDEIEKVMQLFRLDSEQQKEPRSPLDASLKCCQRDRARFEADGVGLFPSVPVNGEDLAGMGIPPGPRYREILDAVEDRVLEGNLYSREEAISWIRSRED